MSMDYRRLWKTLLRTGIKERFSQIRLEFFMKIATDGKCEYTTTEEREKIIEDSKVFEMAPDLIECVKLAIPDGSHFKHHNYATPDGELLIEYFANTSSGIPKEYIDHLTMSDPADYDLDGICRSVLIQSDEDGMTSGPEITTHLIVVGEGGNKIEPEIYPMIIKHELTHACLFEVRKLINNGYYKHIRIPGTWTDEDINNWDDDIELLSQVLKHTDEESETFVEFICEFLMFESDGITKVKNPVSVVDKSKKNKGEKPKTTYRTITPYDRFIEVVDMMEDDYGKRYADIIEALRPYYENYDAFLDEIRM